MELKEFIESTITQLIDGVNSAAQYAKENGAEINPENQDGSLSDTKMLVPRREVAKVNFDVALSVTEGSGTKAGISVLGGAINLGAGGESKSENLVVTRIQFTVPMALPKQS